MRYFIVTGWCTKDSEEDVGFSLATKLKEFPSNKEILSSLKKDGISRITIINIIELTKKDYENYIS